MSTDELIQNMNAIADRLQQTGALKREEVPVLNEIINTIQSKLIKLDQLEKEQVKE